MHTLTQVTGSALTAIQIAHRALYPLETVIPSCCHRFPAESVTFTAGTFGAGDGGCVRDRFVLIVSQPINATRPLPRLVVIRDVPAPYPEFTDPVTCCTICALVPAAAGSAGGLPVSERPFRDVTGRARTGNAAGR